jgi:hypothetical protein
LFVFFLRENLCSFVFRIVRHDPGDAIVEVVVKLEMGSLGLRSFAFLLFCGAEISNIVIDLVLRRRSKDQLPVKQS